MTAIEIRVDDLQGSAIQALLQAHLDAMYEHSPPESVHALDLAALRHPSITFWTAWEDNDLMGCGALKQHDAANAELKSMRTADAHLRKGVAQALLRHILSTARARGIQRISLETGTGPALLTVTKDDGITIVAPDFTTTYTITVTNTGAADLTGIVLVDTIPAGMSFVSASGGGTSASGKVTWPAFDLLSGAATSFTVQLKVASLASLGSITSFANIVDVQDDGSKTVASSGATANQSINRTAFSRRLFLR